MLIREKICEYGIDKLVPEEVISMLTGIKLNKCREYIQNHGLSDIIKYIDVLDITPTQRVKLSLLYDFCLKVNTDKIKDKPEIDSSKKAGEFFVKHLKFERNEKFLMGCLNSQNKLIKIVLLFEGTINEAPVYPREAVRMALGYNANSVIFSHNHPGLSACASQADISVTQRLTAAFNAINIKVVDHIIVAGDKFISLAEQGAL